MNTPVLIAGAGPTGLTLALFLARHDIRARIVDAKHGPVDQSRALGVHARTLEFYRFAGIAERVVARGIKARTAHVVVGEHEKTSLSLEDMGAGISPFPYMLTFAQDDHERLLIETLAELGIDIDWNTRLSGFAQDADGVEATLEGPNGSEGVTIAYLVGCEGAHSVTREGLGFGFSGGTNEGLFYVADVRTDRPSEDIFVAPAEDTISLIFPVRQDGSQRLLGIVPPELTDREDLGFEDVRDIAERTLGVKALELNWFSSYHVNHRVAEYFRKERVFLAGDSGHVHSPVGGQGMNTGIGDAANLAWKLADVLKGRAAPPLLDSYEPERIAFARVLIETTDRIFGPMVATGRRSSFLRSVIAPNALRLVTHLPGLPQRLFRTVSQTRITYRDGPISEGKAGSVRGGDRLPWIAEPDNYEPLTSMDWHIHVYGSVGEQMRAAADRHGLRLHEMPYSEGARDAGFERDALYLVRPDGHVALAAGERGATRLESYLDRHGLTLNATPQELRSA